MFRGRGDLGTWPAEGVVALTHTGRSESARDFPKAAIRATLHCGARQT